MLKQVTTTILTALAAAACTTTSDSKPSAPAWSAFYPVPPETLVGCLAAPAGDGFVVNVQPSTPPGKTRVLFVPRSAPQAESSYSVYRRPDGLTQVDWQRLGNIGGLDWLDVQARERANRCGGA